MQPLLDSIRLWLETTIGPSAPWVLLTALVFGAVRVSRRYLPRLWTWFDDVTPDGLLGKTLQGLPSVLVGALSTVALTGGDVASLWKGAIAGAFAPLLHELAKNYEGAVGPKKPPGGAGTVSIVLLALLVSACTPAEIQSAVAVAKDVSEIARLLCLLDQSKIRGARADVVQDACQTVGQLAPYLDQAKQLQSAPRAMAVCK